MVKNLTSYWFLGIAFLFALSAWAQPADVKEDEAYYLPGLVSDKTIPLYAEKFSKLDGVVVKAYCLSSETLVVEIDRSKQKDNDAVEKAIRSVFNATPEMLPLTAQKKFNTEKEIRDCPLGKMGSEPMPSSRTKQPLLIPVPSIR